MYKLNNRGNFILTAIRPPLYESRQGIRGSVLSVIVSADSGLVRLGLVSGIHVESCSNSSDVATGAACRALVTTTSSAATLGGTVFASNLKFSGGLASLQTLFAEHLTYQGNENFNGNDTLSVTVNDNGNTGAGGNKVASLSLQVEVGADNDLPILTFGKQSFSTSEDTSVKLVGISVVDPETESTSISHEHAGKLK